MQQTLGFLGVGNMAKQLVRAVRRAQPDISILLVDPYSQDLEIVAEEVNAEIADYQTLLQQATLIVVGVKPYQLTALFDELKDIDAKAFDDMDRLWVSMAVSVSLSELAAISNASLKWIRIMPNLPVALGKGVIGYHCSENVNESEHSLFNAIFSGSGLVMEIDESLFDIFGAIAGSGPAFVFQFIEAMSDAAVRRGIQRKDATALAAQIVEGAGALVIDTKEHPGVLKDQVTSPNGTTIAGVVKLEEKGLRSAVIEAIEATYQRSQELS